MSFECIPQDIPAIFLWQHLQVQFPFINDDLLLEVRGCVHAKVKNKSPNDDGDDGDLPFLGLVISNLQIS